MPLAEQQREISGATRCGLKSLMRERESSCSLQLLVCRLVPLLSFERVVGGCLFIEC